MTFDDNYDSIVSGNIVCNAGAGSGKTRLSINRIEYLIKNKIVQPNKLLCITFTNNAVNEIKERLESKNVNVDGMSICTFHAFARRSLFNYNASFFGRFKLVPSWWEMQTANNLIKKPNNYNEYGMDLKGLNVGDVCSYIKSQKNDGIHYNDNRISKTLMYNFIKSTNRNITDQQLIDLYKTYEDIKQKTGYIDQDDFLLFFYIFLKKDETFRKMITERIDYIMVDEFQDTSTIMLKILELLNRDKNNLFVVGDFRQSIYSFMNANVENILNFDETMQDVKTIELSKNYRSDKKIVQLSNEIIENSPMEVYKKYSNISPVSNDYGDVMFTLYQNEKLEYMDIAKDILNNVEKQKNEKFADISIIARTNNDLANVESVLYDYKIPYNINEKASFYRKKDIKVMLEYLKFLNDVNDDHAIVGFYGTPNRFISQKCITDLMSKSNDISKTLFETLSTSSNKGIIRLQQELNSLIKATQKNHNVGKTIRDILKITKYYNHIDATSQSPEIYEDRVESLDRLCEIASDFNSIQAFLTRIDILEENRKSNTNKDAVQLITVHSSKGLEWNTCYAVNIIKDNFPSKMSINEEEERRLFYVCVSRAKHKLFVSWNLRKPNDTKNNVSPYIEEILGETCINNMEKELYKGEKSYSVLY